MNLIEFSEILQHPHHIDKEKIDALENITKEFPFFQAAKAIYLNGLKKQNDYKYNLFLKKTAAYTTDRSILFDFITSKTIDVQNLYPIKEQSTEQNDPVVEIETRISSQQEIEKSKTDQAEERAKELLINKPILFNPDDSYSFNEWLKLTSVKPIEREISEAKREEKEPESNFDLIDKFIANNPKIKPVENIENSNFASQSIIENNSLMTETLAHVYLEQKKYNKAITAFNILSLKYPEKSSFFANQIEKIKKIQQK